MEDEALGRSVSAHLQNSGSSGSNEQAYAKALNNIESTATDADRLRDASIGSGAIDAPHDAFTATFKLQCDSHLEDPFVVALIEYRDESTGTVAVQPFFKELAGSFLKPRKIRIRETGLPLGYTLLKASLHLYDQAAEIPTNESDKASVVSRGEALAQFRAARIRANQSVHRLEAAPIQAFSLRGFRQALTQETLDTRIGLEIDSDGDVVKVSSAMSGAVLSPDVQAVLLEMPFYPAVESGVPVESSLITTIGEVL